jgi:catechol 2,3-dioxygenase
MTVAMLEQSTAGTPIAAATTVGTVRLTVSDLDASVSFYERVLGMSAAARPDGTVALYAGPSGADAARNGTPPLLELRGDPSAPALDRGATGLFHFAVLVPSRRDLAMALLRVARSRWPLDGASDHLVSEALYLSDPDGNGIEIYRDRPREQWRRGPDGLQMATLALDLDGLLAALSRDAPSATAEGTAASIELPALPTGTRIGHVHLQVSELTATESFYSGVLGLEVTVRAYPGALFVAAGGYHHHIGLNTWHSAGAPAPPPGAVGLRSFELRLPDDASLEEVLARIERAQLAAERLDGGGVLVRDPSGNGVLLLS